MTTSNYHSPDPEEGGSADNNKPHSVRRHDGTLRLKHPDWTTIKEIEDTRRKILKRVELPVWRILCYVRGTCLKGIILDPITWITMTIYFVIILISRLGVDPPESAELITKSGKVSILGGFLSFFLALFVNQTNDRFLTMYGFSKECSGRTQDVAGLASTQLPPDLAQQLIRHMNAAHVAGYVGLGGPYSKRHFFDHYNKQHNLMTPQEMEQISHFDMDNGSDVLKELITWCQRDVGYAKKMGHIDSHESTEFHTRIVAFRASMDGIYDFCDQPPHFFYIHFLCFLSAFYLPLFAIDSAYIAGFGENSDWGFQVYKALVVLLQCIFVTGLRLLGQKMVDPYGQDYEDLSVTTYVETTLHICNIINTSTGSYLNNKKIQEDKSE